jgi:hypothetical protein
MADEVHEVVTLLLARMESNPEEFEFHASGSLAVTGRWETWIAQLGWHFNEAEKALIYGKARELIFQRVHGEVLDELLNGEDRRRKEREEQEYERQMMRQSTLAQQQKAYVSQLQGMVGQVYGGGGGAGAALSGYQNAAGAQGIVGKSYTHAIMDEHDSYLDRLRSTPTGSITSVLPVANGGTDNTIINQIKNMLKKGK